MRFDARRVSEHEALTDEEHAWMAQLPLFIRLTHENKPWIITHAGIPTDCPIEKQDPKLLVRTRWVSESDGSFVGSSHTGGEEFGTQPPNTVYWTSVWKGPESVIYGHMVHPKFEPRIELTLYETRTVETFGIDTGCCFGGALTAAVFRDDDCLPFLIAQPAKKAYAPYRHDLFQKQ